MTKAHVTDLITYKWRYRIGYSLITLLLVGTLVFIGLNIPGGITGQEIESTVVSGNMNILNFTTQNYPYHLIQSFSFSLFGLSFFSIKLPSIVLSALTIIILTALLVRWFKPNIGVLATLLAITTGQFIFIAQNGTPDIMIPFWTSLLLLIASGAINAKHKYINTFLFSFVAGLSLYTPLMIYVLMAIATAVLIQPHLRFNLLKISKIHTTLGFCFVIIISIPLIMGFLNDTNSLPVFLGMPTGEYSISSNLTKIADEYLGFNKITSGTYLTPVFELGSSLLILLGVYDVIKNRASARSYIVSFIFIYLIPATILNPDKMAILFLPLVILMATGLRKVLFNWYGLFPLNPYARIGGLIPIVILVSVLVVSGINRYSFLYQYSPELLGNFSTDLKLIPKDQNNLVVSTSELNFYRIFEKYNKSTTVSTNPISDVFLSTKEASQNIKGYQIEKIITNSRKTNSDRFYLYKKQVN